MISAQTVIDALDAISGITLMKALFVGVSVLMDGKINHRLAGLA
jgi:hypothetical protein